MKKKVKNVFKNSNSYKVLLPLEYIYAFCNKVLVAVMGQGEGNVQKAELYVIYKKLAVKAKSRIFILEVLTICISR